MDGIRRVADAALTTVGGRADAPGPREMWRSLDTAITDIVDGVPTTGVGRTSH